MDRLRTRVRWPVGLVAVPSLVAVVALAAPARAQEAPDDRIGDSSAAERPAAETAPVAPTEPTEPTEASGGAELGWFRIDVDSLGLQLWAGAIHEVGGIELASDVYLNGAVAELDVGPQFRLGSLTLIATFGPIFDFSTQDVVGFVAPLLTTIYDRPKFYFESWLQLTFGSPFDDAAEDLFHTRNFALYKVNQTLWIGPQFELNYGLEQADDIISLPIGAQLNVGYGVDNRLSVFLGYDIQEQVDPNTGEAADSDRIAGRVTLVKLW